MTGAEFNTNPRRFVNMPSELRLNPGDKDPQQIVESLQEAYAQNNVMLLNATIGKATEMGNTPRVKAAVEACERKVQ